MIFPSRNSALPSFITWYLHRFNLIYLCPKSESWEKIKGRNTETSCGSVYHASRVTPDSLHTAASEHRNASAKHTTEYTLTRYLIPFNKGLFLLQNGRSLESLDANNLLLQRMSDVFVNLSLCICEIAVGSVDHGTVKFAIGGSMFYTWLFIFCWNGDYLIEQSLAVQRAIYGCPWYNHIKEMSDVRFIIMRAQKPMTLTAGRFYTVTLETYLEPGTTFIGDLTVPPCWKREFVDIEVRSLSHVQRHKSPTSELCLSQIILKETNIINLVDKFRVTVCTERKKSVRWPTKMTDDAVEDARERMQRSPNKSVKKLAVEIGISYGIAHEILRNKLVNLWFMHDGAPTHYCRNVRAYLNAAYPGQWIGRAGPTPWPARSPDMNPLDFKLRDSTLNMHYTKNCANV
ncbi:hypothetical protein ANN_24069 [Periplaneta americana]|uniref:Uncharacterized protein n=1 Tax=Periplaneta americana TaxID=6978 RepID=A0ABQ8S2Q6_PERAM|nr:hypothetical protein ANN_24069 [Periplaneta americana]